MSDNFTLDCHVENDRVCRFAALVALAIAAWHVTLGGQAAATEVDALGAPAPVGFADIVERVKPAVVGVRVKIEEAAQSDEPRQKSPFAPGSPLDRFFRKFGIPLPEKPAPRSGTELGSGFFVSGDGYIVTNNHVVTNGKSFEVTTDGGKTYPAKVIGTDPQTDLALIKVSASMDFPFVRFATGLPRVGDWVLPVGNPFGLGGTVTAGIVSARGRDIGEGPYDDFIQIDAPVNLGNSGGPASMSKAKSSGSIPQYFPLREDPSGLRSIFQPRLLNSSSNSSRRRDMSHGAGSGCRFSR